MKKGTSPVFLVVLLVSVILIVMFAVMEGKKDYEQLEKISETTGSAGTQSEQISDAIQQTNEQIQSEYDNIDDAVE